MDDRGNAATGGNERLSFDHTWHLLSQQAAELDAEKLDGVGLHREAAAAFIADQATLLGVIAEAAGLPTVKLISELLYLNAFVDAESTGNG